MPLTGKKKKRETSRARERGELPHTSPPRHRSPISSKTSKWLASRSHQALGRHQREQRQILRVWSLKIQSGDGGGGRAGGGRDAHDGLLNELHDRDTKQKLCRRKAA